jgi:hypothetical protein
MCIPIARQQISKHTSLTTEQQRPCFLHGPCKVVIRKCLAEQKSEDDPCGGGVEYLHCDPASRRRRWKGKSQIWDSKIRSKSQETRTRERLRWQGPAAHTKDRPVLSSERVSHGMKNVTVRRITYSEREKNLVVSPGWVLYAKTDWPTDRRS